MNNKLNLVNPLNPSEIIKTVELVEKEEVVEKKEVEEKAVIKKKKNNKLIYLPVLLLVVMAFIIYTLINKDDNEYEVKPTILNEISSSLDLENNLDNDKLIVTLTIENGEEKEIKNYEYILEGNLLKTSFKENDDIGYEVFIKIADIVGIKNGYNENEVYNFLKTVNFKTDKVDDINVKLMDNKYTITYDTTKKINLNISEYNYFTVDNLKGYNEFIKTPGNVTLKKDNLVFYKTGTDKEANIIIGEYNDFSILTFNSILSLANSLYPDEKFEESYKDLESKKVGRYDIAVDIELDEEMKNIFNNYDEFKFVQIKIKIG